MTRKEFNERASIHVYGSGSGRRVCLFFDWINDKENGNIGYKYMIKGYGIPKIKILNDSFNILIKKNNENIWEYDLKVAETDSDRFKVPVVF